MDPGPHAAGCSVWPALPRHGDGDPGGMPARDVAAGTHTLAAASVDVGDVQRRAGRGGLGAEMRDASWGTRPGDGPFPRAEARVCVLGSRQALITLT